MSQFRARAWALFGVVSFLYACGGGDGGGGTNAGSPPPPPAQSGLLSATVSYVNGTATLTVLDADQPSTSRTTTLVDDHLIAGGMTIDATTRTDTYAGDTVVYYVRAGQLFQMSLRRGGNNTPQRISSTTAACKVTDWHPLRFDGSDDAWIEITEAGLDSNCAQTSDNRVGYVRSGAPTTAIPIFLPTGVSVLESLPDPVNRTLAGLIAVDWRGGGGPKLIYYSANMALLGDVTGGAGLPALDFMSFRPGPSLDSSAFVKTALELRRLTWSASAASLSAPLHTYWDFPEPDAFLDVNAMYFVDGRRVIRADAAGTVSTVGELSAATAGQVELKGLTSGHVVFEAHGGANLSAIYSLPKSGGTPLPLAAYSDISRVAGVHGDDVVYTVDPLFEGLMTVRRVHASGANSRVITSTAARWPSFVYSPTITYYAGFSIDAVVWCEPLPPATDCRNGTVRSLDLGTGVSTVLGSMPSSSSPDRLRFSGYSYTGQPMLVNRFAADSSGYATANDVYLMRPGSAGSLLRLTTTVP